jgi:hypothetical protein
MHDQNFKNLILDYPVQSLEFFAGKEAGPDLSEARIIPIRQEQLKERLGDRFRELDTPLLVEWPDGRRDAILFLIEEETQSSTFSIYRLAHYCLDLAELMKTDRVIPVVIFLRRGDHRSELRLGSDSSAYLEFRYLACHLWRLPANRYYESPNIVARLNLPNMAYAPEDRLEMYWAAQTGLDQLESSPEKQKKYVDFIDFYADLSDDDVVRYKMRYIGEKGENMGLTNLLREEGRKEGRDEGRMEGIHETVIESIGALLDVKFGFEGIKLFPQLMEIKDIQQLKMLIHAIKLAKTPDDVLKILNDKPIVV